MSVNIGDLEGTLSLEDRFSRALELAGGVTNRVVDGMEGSFKTLAVVTGAVGAAITGMTGTILYLANKGSELNAVEDGLDRIAGGAARADEIMQAMTRGVANTVDSLDLAKFASRALSTQTITTAKDFETVTKAARAYSREGLGDIETIMQQVSTAMATGRVRQLQYLTGSIDLKAAEDKYAKSLGTTRDHLSQAGKLAADRIAIMERLNQKVSQAGDLEKNFAEKLTSTRLTIANWFDDVAKAVAKSGSVNKAFDDIKDAIVNALGGSAEKALERVVGWINKFADAAGYYGPIVVKWIADVTEGVRTIWNRVNEAWDRVPDWFKNIARDAAFAGLAIYGVQKAMGTITGGGGGGGFGLGDAGAIAGMVSGFKDLVTMTGATYGGIKMLWSIIRDAPKVDGIVGYFKNWGTALTIISDTLGLAKWVTAGFWLAVAGGVYAVGESFHQMYKSWSDGRSMWEYFSKGGGFWDHSIIGRLTGMDDAARKAAEGVNKLKDAGIGLMASHGKTGPPGAEFLLGSRQGSQGAGSNNPLEDQSAKIAQATKDSINKTQQLWDQYYSENAKRGGDLLDSQLHSIKRWYDGESATLDKSKKLNANYWNERTALDAVYWERREDAEKEFNERVNQIASDASAAANADWVKEQQRITALNEQGFNKLEDARREYDDLVMQGSKSSAEFQIQQIDRWLEAQLNAFPIGADGWKEYYDTINKIAAEKRNQSGNVMDPDTGSVLSGADYESGHQMINPDGTGFKYGQAFREGFKRGMADFPRLLMDTLTGGGDLGNMFASVGTSITNELFGADGTLAKVTQGLSNSISGFLKPALGSALSGALGAAVSGLLPGVGALLGPLIDKIMSIGGPSKEEMAGRDVVANFEKQFKSVEDMINSVGAAYVANGKSAEQARRDIEALWAAEVEGAEATRAALERINAELDFSKEVDDAIRSGGFLSSDELQHNVDVALAAYNKMLESGKYTQDQINQQYYNWQKSMADAGDAAAAAWIKAQDAIKDGASEVSDAVAKLKSEWDSLNEQVSQEAPEPDMGVIERQQREQMDRIKDQIAAQDAAAANGLATMSDAADAAGQANKDNADASAKAWQDAAFLSAEYIKELLGQLHIQIPVDFDVRYPNIEQPEPQPMAKGGWGHASGPMTFSTQGGEDYFFSGEGRSFKDWFPSGGGGRNITVPVYIGRKLVKTEVINELEASPTRRDKQVLASVTQ